MKSIFRSTLATVLTALLLAVPAVAAETTPAESANVVCKFTPVIDGVIDVKDLTRMMKYLAEK